MGRLLQSSKFWAAIIGIVGVVLVQLLNVPEDMALKIQAAIVTLVGLFIGGTALEDVAKNLRG